MRRLAWLLGLLLAGCSSCEEAGAEQLEQGRQLAEEQAGRLGEHAERLLEPNARGREPEAAPPPDPRDGNTARLLINGEASFLERMRLIDSAEESIYVQALIFEADTVGTAIADRLIARKRANPDLDIRVIVDAYANIQNYEAQLLYFELEDAGIAVQGYEPLYLEWMNEINVEDWTAGNKRYHEKYFVVDGERAVVGGMNIGDEYARIGDEPARIWRDQDIYLEGPVVADIAQAFEENFDAFEAIRARRPRVLDSDAYWNAWRRIHPDLRGAVTGSMGRSRPWRDRPRTAYDPERMRLRATPSETHEDVRVQLIRSRPRLGERWIDEAYRERIDAAERSVLIANAYFIPTDALRDSLIAAARRGVEVTVLTNSKETNDIPLINDAGRISYLPLMEAGVRMYEWHAERHDEGTWHAKIAVIDEEAAIVGSYNLDPRSLALNSEDIVIVEHAPLAAELYTRVMETDLRFADRITDAQAQAWSDPALIPAMDRVPSTPWWDPRFDADRFELFLIGRASRGL